MTEELKVALTTAGCLDREISCHPLKTSGPDDGRLRLSDDCDGHLLSDWGYGESRVEVGAENRRVGLRHWIQDTLNDPLDTSVALLDPEMSGHPTGDDDGVRSDVEDRESTDVDVVDGERMKHGLLPQSIPCFDDMRSGVMVSAADNRISMRRQEDMVSWSLEVDIMLLCLEVWV